MDLVLRIADEYILDRLWAHVIPLNDPYTNQPLRTILFPNMTPNASVATLEPLATSAWPRDYIPRQLLSLFMLTWVGIFLAYFVFAGLSFQFLFNHKLMQHPHFLKNQIAYEIRTSLKSFPIMTLLMLPWFQAEVMGYSRLYDDVSEYGWPYFFCSILLFFLVTEYCVYWVHRTLHHPMLYKSIHKSHHKLKVPTPFASHACHPLDGYFHSIPYHLFTMLFPLHRGLYLGLFVAINFWTIFIHDSEMFVGHSLEHVINSPSHHTLHHLHSTVNYGQYFTFADRVGGSYRHPELRFDPLLDVATGKDKTL